MKILLVNIDSKIPNLALAKIAKYHQLRGDEVFYNLPTKEADKIYVSCVFTKNKKIAEEWVNSAEIGGSGYDLTIKLPQAIEEIKPKINIGFTTRGCIRNCPFCIVPQKEGGIRIVGDLLDLWDGKAKDILVLDNNILALPEHFETVCNQAIKNRIRIDFNQGLDHRLLTPDIVSILSKTPHKEYKFAFDFPSYKPTVDKAITLLQEAKINRCTWYVLVGFNTTFEEDLARCNYLKERNQNVFVQRYETCCDKVLYLFLARWGNQHHIFQKYTFMEFLEHPENKKRAVATGVMQQLEKGMKNGTDS